MKRSFYAWSHNNKKHIAVSNLYVARNADKNDIEGLQSILVKCEIELLYGIKTNLLP